MIKVIEERPVPRATAICLNCRSTLEYGNADLHGEHQYERVTQVQFGTLLSEHKKVYYFICPVCGCKVYTSWIGEEQQ